MEKSVTTAGDTRAAILATAQAAVQQCGFAELSFRDLAGAIGIKSSSVHYHFPTKAALGAELMRSYTAAARRDLADIATRHASRAERLRAYGGLFRRALADGNRMCLYGILAAETGALPSMVRDELADFERANVEWLAALLADGGDAPQRARAIFAAMMGAQVVARGQGDIAVFDGVVDMVIHRLADGPGDPPA